VLLFTFNIHVVITDVAKILGGSCKFFWGGVPPKHAWIKPCLLITYANQLSNIAK